MGVVATSRTERVEARREERRAKERENRKTCTTPAHSSSNTKCPLGQYWTSTRCSFCTKLLLLLLGAIFIFSSTSRTTKSRIDTKSFEVLFEAIFSLLLQDKSLQRLMHILFCLKPLRCWEIRGVELEVEVYLRKSLLKKRKVVL